MCNLYHKTGEGSADVCDGPGGGNSHLSETGIEQAKELNESMHTNKGIGVHESDHNGVIEYSVRMANAFLKFKVTTRATNTKLSVTNDTKILVSTMNRAIETAKHAFKGFGNCKFEYTKLLEEVVAGDNYAKRYKDYLKLARQIKNMETEGINAVVLVCHHNTIRYMICALSKVYGLRYPNIHFNVSNASFVDMQFLENLKTENWTYCIADKGTLIHTPQTTQSMTSDDASEMLIVGAGGEGEHLVSSEAGRIVVYSIDKNRPDLATSVSDMKFIKAQLPKLSVELILTPEYILTTQTANVKPNKVPREFAIAFRLDNGATKVLAHTDWYPISRTYNIPGVLVSITVLATWWVYILAQDSESYKGYILAQREMTDKLFEKIPNNFDVPLYVMAVIDDYDNTEFVEY